MADDGPLLLPGARDAVVGSVVALAVGCFGVEGGVDGESSDEILRRIIAFNHPAVCCPWERTFGALPLYGCVEGEVCSECLCQTVDIVVRYETDDHVGHDHAIFPGLALGGFREPVDLCVVEHLGSVGFGDAREGFSQGSFACVGEVCEEVNAVFLGMLESSF